MKYETEALTACAGVVAILWLHELIDSKLIAIITSYIIMVVVYILLKREDRNETTKQ